MSATVGTHLPELSLYGDPTFIVSTAIATRDYPPPARRPHNSRLDCTRLQAAFDLRLPPWQDGVRRMLAETL